MRYWIKIAVLLMLEESSTSRGK